MERRGAIDAGGGDDAAERAECAERRRERIAHLPLVPDITGNDDAVTAERSGSAIECVAVAIDERNRHTRRSGKPRDREPDPASTPGDEDRARGKRPRGRVWFRRRHPLISWSDDLHLW